MILVAGIQSGKTTVGAIIFLNELVKRAQRWLIAGHKADETPLGVIMAPTDDILSQSTKIKFEEIVQVLEIEKTLGKMKWNGRGGFYYFSQSGIKILCKSAYNPNSIEGFTADIIWADEGGQYRDIVYSKMQDRTEKRQGRIIITTTPYYFNWLYRDIWIPIMEKGQALFRTELVTWRTEDNYVRYKQYGKWHWEYNYDKEYIKEQKRKLSIEEYKLRYEGTYERPSNLIYKFDREDAIRPRAAFPTHFDEVIMGFDYGMNHPMAVVIVGILSGVYYIIDEFRMSNVPAIDESGEHGLSAENIIKEMASKYKVSWYYGDQAAKSTMQKLRYAGIPLKDADKGDGSVKEGIWYIQSLFIQGRIIIAEECVKTIKEFREYHRKADSYGLISDIVYKKDDDLMDALRYAIFTHRVIDQPSGKRVELIFPPAEELVRVYATPNELENMLKTINPYGDLHGVDSRWYFDN